MASKPTGNPPGQPPKVTSAVVSLLVSSFQNGLNVTQSCLQAGISRDTYYEHVKNDPGFSDKMELAQGFASMKARQVLVTKINQGDEATAKWWLERKDKKEFALRQEVTGEDGAPINPGTADPSTVDDFVKHMKNDTAAVQASPD